MPRRSHSRQEAALRAQFASTAARLMAEDGISDYALAKKKAAQQLGLAENTPPPDDSEVETELRLYQLLFQGERGEHLRALRQAALTLMQVLADFRPYLTGSVLDGTAGEFAEINIQLFADSAKEVEIFLLNRGIEFEHTEPRTDKAEAVLVVPTAVADANLIIYPPHVERISLKSRDGRPKERAKIETLIKMLSKPNNSGEKPE